MYPYRMDNADAILWDVSKHTATFVTATTAKS